MEKTERRVRPDVAQPQRAQCARKIGILLCSSAAGSIAIVAGEAIALSRAQVQRPASGR